MRIREVIQRRGATLLEVLFAIVISVIILMATMSFLQVGTRSVVVSTDHAQARDDAITILNVIARDLDRIVVGDNYDRLVFPNVVEPIMINDSPQASRFIFYCFHHRNFYRAEQRMELLGQLVEYKVVKRPGVDQGVDLLRNDQPINPNPLDDVHIKKIDEDRALKLGISPFHSFEVVIQPRGVWDTKNKRLTKFNPQTRLFHLSGIESQYACLLSLKEAGAPYPILALVPNPPARSQVYTQYQLEKVPMDWLRPQNLVKLSDTFFDEATAGRNQEIGVAGPRPAGPPPPNPNGPGVKCAGCNWCPMNCPKCDGTGTRCTCGGCNRGTCRG